MIAHQLHLRNPNGVLLSIVQDGAFAALSYALKENEPGVLELTLPGSFDISLLPIDGLIDIYRTYGAGATTLEGNTAWFIRKAQIVVDENDVKYIHVLAYTACELLARRIVAYVSGSAYAEKTAVAWDDMMRALVRENFGALALNTARNLAPYLTVQTDATLGAVSTRSMAWRVVLNVLQDIIDAAREQGEYGAFDVVETSPGIFQFQVFMDARGVDHSETSGSPVVVSRGRHNLDSPQLTFNWEAEHNFIYATGQGQGEERIVKYAQDDARIGISPFNRREFNQDARQSKVDDSVQSEAYAALEEGRPKQEFTGKIIQTESSIYGVHWGWGDIVTAEFEGLTIDCHVEAVTVTVDATGTEIVQGYLRSVRDAT